jgi:polyferredoxin
MVYEKTRRRFQVASTLVVNAYLPAWLKGTIVQWKGKGICFPVLNCYSCPSAVGACPIGALQNFLATARFNISIGRPQIGLYVLGVIGAFGSLLGRLPCGWLCPFGLAQDLMHKIPSPKLPIPKILTNFRYVVLAVMVVALPLLVMDEYGMGKTWFCAWICPSGTLGAGLPLVSLNAGIREQVGFMFAWKVGILLLFLLWMTASERAFCRTTCPLGALLGFFNRVSLFRLRVDPDKCAECKNCDKTCPVKIRVSETPNSSKCIRCLRCVDSCPRHAVEWEFLPKKKSPASVETV